MFYGFHRLDLLFYVDRVRLRRVVITTEVNQIVNRSFLLHFLNLIDVILKI